MKVEQIYTSCMAHAAYYIENKGEAAIFDPLREVEPYIERAQKDSAKIKYVFETHFHADFVSGHNDLVHQTGAQVVFGPTAKPGYPAIIAEDNQDFKVGDYTVRAIHTPGHTMESTTYLLIDENGKEYGIISGDTLFIGDVGRPDLAQHVISELTEEKLAGLLYDSLRNKIMPLSDDLIVFPNHGAGSACGKMMSKETTDTLGNQKKVNYALQPELTKEEFIKVVLHGLTTPPAYFPKNVLMNINGSPDLADVLSVGSTPLSLKEFEKLASDPSVLLLDCRSADDFSKGFIPNSINIGLDGSFAMWVGELIPDIRQKIALVCNKGEELEALTRLSRVGYDHSLGFLAGGIEVWKAAEKPLNTVTRINASTFEERYKDDAFQIIDVRKQSEFESQHVQGALNIPLNQLERRMDEIPQEHAFVLYCAGGYRSMIAASILKKHAIFQFVDVEGGITAILNTKTPVTQYVCPTTLL